MFNSLWLGWAYFQVKILIPLLSQLQLLVVIISSLLIRHNDYPSSAIVQDGQRFDFIVIGAGSAGCVVANRLTEIGNWSVLLIEAGDDPPYVSEIPGVSILLGSTFPDWNYYSDNSASNNKSHQTRKIHQIKGKLLGGSSSVNYMYYVRGNEADYQNWAHNSNNNEWGWDSVVDYFKKSEHLNDAKIKNSEFVTLHGTTGYLGVTRPEWREETKNYFEAFRENGHDILLDINGFKQLGYSVPSYTIAYGCRQSLAHTFIAPIKNRTNLYILKNTLARKIILAGNKAIGVEFQESNDVIKTVTAEKEIILSAGAINSPQILMLSGIGPEVHLKQQNIEALVDIPEVGANLQDHIIVPIIISEKNKKTSLLDNFSVFKHTNTFPVPTIMGHVALNKNQSYPDYQVTAFPLPRGSILPILMCYQVFQWNEEACISIAKSTRYASVFALITFLHPKSRGKIRLKSNNPNDKPLIYTEYLTEEDDLNKYAKCLKDFTSVVKTSYFREMNSEIADLKIEQCNGIPFETQKYWKCYVKNMIASQFHFTGTCAMGSDGVVDERLKVRGVDNLRVVDASVMPSIVSGNTNAPVIMISEKASDFIKIDNGIFENT